MAHIILIEDDPWISNIFRQLLENAGHVVDVAENGQQGFDMYRANPADLVITDIVMPVKDGLETILDLKNEFPHARVIAISGGGAIESDRYLSLAESIGAIKALQKPLTKEELLAAVDESLAGNP
jgi:DNA-binding response OmpR family regulator